MNIIALDPDLHNTGLAIGNGNRILSVEVISIPKALVYEDAVLAMSAAVVQALRCKDLTKDSFIVEAQEVYFMSKAPPDSILRLAQVAGACVAACIAAGAKVGKMPLPKEWKGSVPKNIHQARTCAHYGWKWEDKGPKKGCAPILPETDKVTGWDRIPGASWTHVLDACGLVRWMAEKGGSL